MTGSATEQLRRECEARHWLRQGFSTRAKVAELMVSVEKLRGRDAAIALRQEMRRQWARRGEWLTDGASPCG